MDFSAVILAGGASQRMGTDKAWLRVAGRPLISRQIELARAVGAAEVFISGRPEVDYSQTECPVLFDRFACAGPLAGIERALGACSESLLLVLPVDLPALDETTLATLLVECSLVTGAIPTLDGQIEPLVAFYPKSAHPISVSLLTSGQNAVRDFAVACVNRKQAVLVPFGLESGPVFQNCNSPSDLH